MSTPSTACSLLERNDPLTIDDMLDQVINFTLQHFCFEEELMEQAGYPLSEPHRQLHRSFAMRIQNYRRRALQGEDVGKILLGELRPWLVPHIKKDDRAYAMDVRAHLEGQVMRVNQKTVIELRKLES